MAPPRTRPKSPGVRDPISGATSPVSGQPSADEKLRGYHGCLPHHEAERGFVILLDGRYRVARKDMDITDVAPTMLHLLGERRPEFVKGERVLET
jgi:bisphosphoglycerate-independent phosphoglycerate mutase (AlkP superfamily)